VGYREGGVELVLPILIKVYVLLQWLSLCVGVLLILYYYYTIVPVESQVFMRWGAGTELLHPLGSIPAVSRLLPSSFGLAYSVMWTELIPILYLYYTTGRSESQVFITVIL
jgi:hypothetical protein